MADVGGVNAEVMGVLARCCPLLRHLELGGCSAIGDEAVLKLRSSSGQFVQYILPSDQGVMYRYLPTYPGTSFLGMIE